LSSLGKEFCSASANSVLLSEEARGRKTVAWLCSAISKYQENQLALTIFLTMAELSSIQPDFQLSSAVTISNYGMVSTTRYRNTTRTRTYSLQSDAKRRDLVSRSQRLLESQVDVFKPKLDIFDYFGFERLKKSIG
jgi:hypothetical protein